MLKLEGKNSLAQQPKSPGYISQILRKEHCLPFSKKLKNLQEKCKMLSQKNLGLKGEQLQTSSWMPDDDIQRFRGTCTYQVLLDNSSAIVAYRIVNSVISLLLLVICCPHVNMQFSLQVSIYLTVFAKTCPHSLEDSPAGQKSSDHPPG